MLPIHPMAWLLKYEGYPPAVVVAAAVHGFLLYILLGNPVTINNLVDLDEPVYINATTVADNPQRLRRLEQLQVERQQVAEAQRQREQEAAAQQAREAEQRQETARQAELQEQQRQERELAQRRQQEAEREAQRQRAAEEQQRLEQQSLEQQRQQELARQQEAARQAELERQQALAAQQATADARAVDTYIAIIHNTVAGNWVIPPSARNGMTAVLSIRLVPTGEVVAVDIIQSSGDSIFDRSVEQAVRRSQRFPELQGMSTTLFEASFRNLTLTFRPEDLLR